MFVNPVNVYMSSLKPQPCFKGVGNKAVSGYTTEIPIKLFNPFSNNFCSESVELDLSEPSVFQLENKMEEETPLIVDYNPARTGSLYDKKSGMPFRVSILKTTTENFSDSVGYYFMSKDLKKEYGYVHLFKSGEDFEQDSELMRNYEKEGVIGSRVEVLYLKNHYDSYIGGVGKLADKMAVRYCIENGIEPNIVSYADTGSHVAHYKRGKRFIEPSESSDEGRF